MKREVYRNHIIDEDGLGRPYIYNRDSPYSEASDHILVRALDNQDCYDIIDIRIATGSDFRGW